ncbi:4-hydroxybenzoate octaprenyltransferase [Phenylobacterium sp. J367]|uniref:4-hydroxybenzoate octaprenyltransferase n=1 Tax=Phenylobacterium sp. J367 TaxID=2898435 RepID=UPI002150DF3D|nr:4-hydroxybenzoate octaprenyltransferase [Phenylobacterium sp. J367]MCR5877480.1 4-hydroxybenzoate octaprenyltransferase [Phenylobacterium sp. J367]
MTSAAPLPDAAPTNWVDRYAPASLRPWLKIGRFDRPAGIWLLMLPGWQGVALAAAQQGLRPDWKLLASFFVGAALMRAAGCAYNDIVDRDIDVQVARTAGRPIPSGQISVKQAWAFIAVCSLISFAILLTFPPIAIGLGVGSLLLVAAYPFMKRITWWPQAWLGLTFNWGALLGYAAATGHLGWPAVLLYAGGLFWTLGYDTIYAIQDLEDDALVGVKSSTRRLGGSVQAGVAGFYVMAVVLALAAGWAAHLGWAFYALTLLYAVRLLDQARRVRTDRPMLALKLFKSNAWAGLILFAAIVLGSFGEALF